MIVTAEEQGQPNNSRVTGATRTVAGCLSATGFAICVGLIGLIPARGDAGAGVAASEANQSPQMGERILPTAREWVQERPSYERTAEEIAAAQAQMPNPRRLPKRFLPEMDPAAYEAAKAAAQAAQAPSAEKDRALTPDIKDGPYVAPGTIIFNRSGPRRGTPGNGGFPPDTTGAIGPTQVVYPVNQSFNVYSRSSGALLMSVSFNAFFGTNDALSDPRVIYDPVWSRWVVTDIRIPPAADDPNQACFWLAASQTSDPTGSWWVYRPCMTGGFFANGDLWDYDQLGISQDAVLVTGDIFAFPFTGPKKGPAVVMMPKDKVYNGLSFSVNVFTQANSVGTIAPPIIQDSNENGYFLATESTGTNLLLYRGNNMSSETESTFELQAQISVPTYTVPPGARQPGTTERLDTLDARFQAASTQYNNSLWNVHTINSDTFPAPRFYQIDTDTNTVVQSGVFFESPTSDDFNPSIAVNSSGEAFVTWNSTDAVSTTGQQHNARVRFSGREASDPLGTIPAGTALVTSPVALTGNFQDGVQRWGDYSAVSLDPAGTSTCAVNRRAAVFNEKIINASTWGSQDALIGFCN